MPLTNFPQGVSSFGIPLIGAGPILTTGSVFFVNNSVPGASNGNIGDSPDRPLATLDFAIGKCVASRNDVIILGPGHRENLTAAFAVDVDVSGVQIHGIGHGENRPTFNFTTSTAASFRVGGNGRGVTLSNILFTGGIDALTGPLAIQGPDCRLLNIETRDVTGQATNFINTNSATDRLLIDGWFHNGAAAAGAQCAIFLNGCENPVIRNFSIIGNFSVAAIDIRTAAVVDLEIYDGYIWNKNSADTLIVDTITGSTGRIGPNICGRLADDAANITGAFSGATFHYFQPLPIVNANGESSLNSTITASTNA